MYIYIYKWFVTPLTNHTSYDFWLPQKNALPETVTAPQKSVDGSEPPRREFPPKNNEKRTCKNPAMVVRSGPLPVIDGVVTPISMELQPYL